MGRKQKDIVFGKDTLLKVQVAWKAYQEKTKMSQAAAAHSVSMNQSAFSQYLRGHIGLNTEFLIRFSRMVGIEPGHFSSLLVSYDEAAINAGGKGMQVTFIGTLTTETPHFSKVVFAHNGIEAREVRVDTGPFPAGTTLLLAKQGSPIHEGNICFIRDNNETFIGTMMCDDGHWCAVVKGLGVTTIKELSSKAFISRLEGTILPYNTRARRYDPSCSQV